MGNRFGFVCLANSRKAGGRCVAGKAFKKSSRRWVWVRPVNQYNKLPVENSLLNTGNEPKICDWIHLDWLEKHSGLAYQPENFLFQSKKWQWKGVVKENYLNQLTDRPETLWDNISSTRAGINDKVTLEKANGYNHSLYFIKAEDVVFHGIQNSFDPYNLKKKVEFTYNDSRYKLSLTDPYENQITQIQSFEVQKDFNVYLTISLGEPFNEEAYKLVAGVVFVKEIDDKTLFTIGHSTHEIDHFISLLKKYEITVIGDVRSHPSSQYNPQFNMKPLREVLMKNGIKYVFLGKELGARSNKNDHYDESGKVQYKLLAKDENFKRGLDRIHDGQEKGFRIALMCAEKDPATCHRSILVCKNLKESIDDIRHILSNDTLEKQEEMEKRLMSDLNILPDLLRNDDDCIEEAYEKQEKKIAYTKAEK